MKWLVCINDEGVQCKVPVGKDTEKAAEEQKNLKKYGKIMFVFDSGGKDPDKDYEAQKEYGQWLKRATDKLHKKYGAASPSEVGGYNLRKQYAMGNGIEVLANLDDAKDYDEFAKNYSGLEGAVDILLNTERIMSGNYNRENPGKSVMKMIKKLQLEIDDE